MKFSLFLRLFLGLSIAVVIFASVARASLEDILAPLPVAEIASVSKPAVREAFEQTPTVNKPVEAVVLSKVVEESIDPILVSDVQDAITEAVERSLRPAGELTLIPLRDFPDLSPYSRPFEVNLVQVPSRLSRGNVMLRYQVENEKGILGEWSMPFRVHLYSDVWFPRAHLRRGDIATPSDFEIRQLDLLAEPDAVPATLESLLRHEYSRDIVPGQPLVWRDLMERAMVRKGDVVEVTAVNGLLAITMRAVARQDGSDGDLIVLRNLDSAKEFSARVIGENRAEVAF